MIRKANKEDVNALNELLYQVHKVHSDVRPDLFKAGEKKYNDEELLVILNDDTKPIFLYEEYNKVLGYAFCVIINHENDHSLVSYKSLYIDDLCVNSSIRGKGIGKQLYEYVLNFAKSLGCYNVTLNVWADNDSALKFYEKIGMHIQKIGMEKIL